MNEAPKNVYIETFGCQMNENDTEILSAILASSGSYKITNDPAGSDVYLLNTCSVRENAEKTVLKRLENARSLKRDNPDLVVGILGCMAEHMRETIFEKSDLVNVIIGPDEYRKAPGLIDAALDGEVGIAVKLSRVETYEDIEPLRKRGISAWISIMRGCNNFCTYCVVPLVRGRERSLSLPAVIDSVAAIADEGFKEITFLGQNVNSYRDEEYGADFADLLERAAVSAPYLRFRFTTSHPKDMSERLIEVMAEYPNICNHIHLPLQSGSNRILKMMNRKYDRERYLSLVEQIRSKIPDCSLSADIIAGFPGETDEDHRDTIDMLEHVRFDGAFMFKYSPREGAQAYAMGDTVPDEVKSARLTEIIELQNSISRENNEKEIGVAHEVLVEGESRRNASEWMGRSTTNKVIIFPNPDLFYKPGDLVNVRITRSTSATLFGEPIKIAVNP